jgi:hypothetical protein
MKTPSTLLAAVFALVALGLGTLAWRQHGELIQLRAKALDSGDRAVLQKRIWDAEKRAKDSEARALAARSSEAPETGPDAGNPGDAPKAATPTPGAKKGPSQQEILAFLTNPEIQLALAKKFREQVDTRYGALLKSLNLPGPEQARLRELLIERQGAVIDVAAALLASGAKPKDKDINALVSVSQDETDRKLQAAFGPEVYTQFQAYENAQLFRGATTNLQNGLERLNAPLDAAQAEKFTAGISLLAQNSFTPEQQQALRAITRMEQSRQTLKQVEQIYKDQQNPTKPEKPGKKPGK